MKPLMISLGAVAAAALAACAHGMAGSPPYVCAVDYGYAKGTADYRDCMQKQLAMLNSRGDAQKRQALEAVAVGVAAYGETRRPANLPAGAASPRLVMCPDGQWQAGSRCIITPDGRWIGVP